MDRLVADPDVTTFLNDRFHAVFLSTYGSGGDTQPTGTVRFYDGCGRPLTDVFAPESPEAFITSANEVIVRTEAHACEGQRFPA